MYFLNFANDMRTVFYCSFSPPCASPLHDRNKEIKKSKIRFVQSLFDFVLGRRCFFFSFSAHLLAFSSIFRSLSLYFNVSHDREIDKAIREFWERERKKSRSATKERSQRLINSISTTMSAVNGREKIYLNLNNKFKSLRFIPR